jgi:sulfoxide reductase heme-binding subunit YedZ
MTPDPLDHGWWLASRSAGIVALVAISLSVIFGLMMANGLPRRPGANKLLVSLHEASALAGLVALAIHGVTLLGDPFLHPTFKEIVVPFTIAFKPVYVGLGIIGGWIAAILGLTFYARKRIGPKLWRKVHRATIIAWVLSVIHTLGSGTDANEQWLRVSMLAMGIPIVFLFLRRTVPGDPKREAAARARLADAGI